MDKLQMFDGTVRKVSGFLIVCQLYIRMKIRDILVKKVGAVDTIIYIRRTNRYVGEYNGELRKWQFDICNSRKFFHWPKTRVWRREWQNNKDNCYNLKLGLGCNLGKDLSKSGK